ncbi:hypothetical protein TrRE_jg9583 [Triparma retinervis]|uniref:FAD-binding PCMH-type domain-containing protein n=1 Tax=Triparma retinervis TaxID=2557542 RepID=A0A9W6ZTX3_9STRA|nr:hypothetical protein TrRE_jg9583 [Triparma retinervis]
MALLTLGVVGKKKCYPGDDSCFPTSDDFKDLETRLSSSLIYPSNVLGWRSIGPASLHNGRLDTNHVPYVATFATTSSDVKEVMKFVNEFDLLFSVKSTGHCYSGNCMSQDSFHLDLTKMKEISYDEASSTVTIEPGSNFDALYALNEETRTQSVGGMCGTVGPVGFSLGGGHGPLIRSYGLGADQIVSVDMILSNGEPLTVTEESDKDLFWALRGGGGGTFGVVTSMTLKTYRAPEQLISYSCNYPLKTTSDETVGEEIVGDCSFANHTSLKAWHDTRWFGKVPMKMRNYMATSFAQQGFDGKNVAKITIEAVINSENMMSSFFGIQTGGAVREGSEGSAVSDAFRGSEMLLEADANWITKMNDEKEINWTKGIGDDVHNLDDFKGAYVNEPDPQIEDFEDRFWGDKFEKLQEIKRRVDVGDIFWQWQGVYSEDKPTNPQ